MKANMWRIRISVLWIADVIALTAAYILAMFEPGFLEGLTAGNLEGMEINLGVVILAAFFWLIPLLMMYLSLVLGRPLLRWLNIIFGLILGLLNLVDFINQISSFDLLGIARLKMIGLMAIIPLVIAWHGWKWPEEAE